MTLEFAKIEAERRTKELWTVHYVVRYSSIHDETCYIVSTRIPRGYTLFATFDYVH